MSRRPAPVGPAVVLGLLATAMLAGCSRSEVAPPPTGTTAVAASPTAGVRLPPTTGAFDYQLDEPYPPASDVSVVVRDRVSRPPSGRYGVCYVNAFQTQPQERATWLRDRAALVLRDAAGVPVEDPDWPGEMLLDIGGQDRRAAAAEVVSAELDACLRQGFAATELDNLDSWTRSRGLLTQADAAAYATLLVRAAHARGLAVAQKNAAELLGAPELPRFDFAVTEDCGAFDECGAFTAVYGDRVFDVEYTDAGLDAACAASPPVRVVRRDLALAAPGAPGHVLEPLPRSALTGRGPTSGGGRAPPARGAPHR